MPKRTKTRTRKIPYQAVSGYGEKIDYRFVDKKIRALIRVLNKIPDVATFASCEGHGEEGQFYIWMGARTMLAIRQVGAIFDGSLERREDINGEFYIEPEAKLDYSVPMVGEKSKGWQGLRIDIKNIHRLSKPERERCLDFFARKAEAILSGDYPV